MKLFVRVGRFFRDEHGSLLVFFVVSIVAILGIMALSFDMGRRASTQTDMQSFADNVALAAAGELDGRPDSIDRARAAAQNAIVAANETLKAGASGTAATLTFDPLTDLVFYSDLPPSDTPSSFAVADLVASKYTLPTGPAFVTTQGVDAAFVGITLDTIDVDWMFANIFGSANLPGAAIGAVAVAGRSGWACEIAPVMFCLPRDSNGVPKDLVEGQAVHLNTTGRNAAWNAGQFGYLNIDDSVPLSGPCAGLNPESRRQACILARGIGACFNSRNVDIQTGQRRGQEAAGFNLPFGLFNATMNGLGNDPVYATGPHTISGQIHTNNCRIQSNAVPDTMAFPPDDCHTGAGGASPCPDGRFGDGDWTHGRTQYVETNYTLLDSGGTVVEPGSFFDFPDADLTRYQYYLREIARAANGGIDQNSYNPTSAMTNDSWDDYWPTPPSGGFNPIIPNAHGKRDNGLPQCNSAIPSANSARRVIIAAGINCPPHGEPGHLNGNERDVPVHQYYRVFMMAPARNLPGGGNQEPNYEMWVEIIEPVGGEAGASTLDAGVFREVIQLYR